MYGEYTCLDCGKTFDDPKRWEKRHGLDSPPYLDGAIIQVEGNINARNYSDSGQALSAERAKAVAKYFIACGIDPNRLITVGNGNTKMVADPGSADAYLNRRTDVFFKIIEE